MLLEEFNRVEACMALVFDLAIMEMTLYQYVRAGRAGAWLVLVGQEHCIGLHLGNHHPHRRIVWADGLINITYTEYCTS
jgi:hypothetical protein